MSTSYTRTPAATLPGSDAKTAGGVTIESMSTKSSIINVNFTTKSISSATNFQADNSHSNALLPHVIAIYFILFLMLAILIYAIVKYYRNWKWIYKKITDLRQRMFNLEHPIVRNACSNFLLNENQDQNQNDNYMVPIGNRSYESMIFEDSDESTLYQQTSF